MPSITKTFHTSTGHRLANHPGKCRNLHGHNYEISVTLTRRHGTLDENGMICDFDTVKELAGSVIAERMDHRFLIAKDDPWAKLLKDLDLNVLCVNFAPTAENIARNLFDIISVQVWPDMVRLHSIKVQETPSAYAEVFHS